jgi:hypothetical protein
MGALFSKLTKFVTGHNLVGTPDQLVQIAWIGTASRQEAEKRLEGRPVGTFLTRWSTHTDSYVVSHVISSLPNVRYCHVGGITPSDSKKSLIVQTHNNEFWIFGSLFVVITFMIENGQIKFPVNTQHPVKTPYGPLG